MGRKRKKKHRAGRPTDRMQSRWGAKRDEYSPWEFTRKPISLCLHDKWRDKPGSEPFGYPTKYTIDSSPFSSLRIAITCTAIHKCTFFFSFNGKSMAIVPEAGFFFLSSSLWECAFQPLHIQAVYLCSALKERPVEAIAVIGDKHMRSHLLHEWPCIRVTQAWCMK